MDRDAQQSVSTSNPFQTVRERHFDDAHPAPWSRPDGTNDPTVRFFWILLSAHIILWTVLPAVTQPNLPLDTVELLALGSQPSWGYYDHAPMPAWLAYGACALLGKAAWPAYLLAQFCTATCIWVAWRVAREFLHPWTAICAAFALEGSLFFTFYSPELSPFVFSRCWWALASLTFYWALVGNRRRHWLATAVFLALGFLSTYDTVLLMRAMILFTVWNERARQCWDSSRPILGMMLMGLILLPHTMWLFRHDFITVTATMGGTSMTAQGHLVNPLWFGLSQLGTFIPVILLLAPLIRAVELDEAQEVEPDREFLRRYLVWVTALPFLVMLAGSLVTGADLKSMWSGGQWTLAGVALLMWSRLDEQRWGWRRSILWAGAVAGGLGATLVVHHQMLPGIRTKPSRIHFPGTALAQTVQSTWNSMYPDRKLPVVGGTTWLAGNASWYGKDSPDVYADLDTQRSPWLSDAEFSQTGGMIIWDMNDKGDWLNRIQTRFPRHTIVPQPAVLRHQTRAAVGDVQIALAVIHPANVNPQVQQASLIDAQASQLVSPVSTFPASSQRANPAPVESLFQNPVPLGGQLSNPGQPRGAVSNAAGIQVDGGATQQTSGQFPATRPAGASATTRPVSDRPFAGSTIPANAKLPAATPTGSGIVPSTPGAAPSFSPTLVPSQRSSIPGNSSIPAQRSSIPSGNMSPSTIPSQGNSSSSGLAAPFPPLGTGTQPSTIPTGRAPVTRQAPPGFSEQ